MPGATLPEAGAPGRDRGARARILQNAEFCRFEARTSKELVYSTAGASSAVPFSILSAQSHYEVKFQTFSASPLDAASFLFSFSRTCSKFSPSSRCRIQNSLQSLVLSLRRKELVYSTAGASSAVPFSILSAQSHYEEPERVGEREFERERGPTDCLPECRRTTLKAVSELFNPSSRFRFTVAAAPTLANDTKAASSSLQPSELGARSESRFVPPASLPVPDLCIHRRSIAGVPPECRLFGGRKRGV
ncbi:hypothetical protein LR48_Vigan499s000400 [Vigna angularis]|uniref:Uncharacterized protein n=1 Tax=Phaseolus angularis TaxID=3914 RepID=A0A0L9TBR3_PHAAN|nr:hypothetical protein LR48_Vigan499s000400 [Vigna angularis]